MAIFRKGVKIGGFDIRVGFPRDRSYDNIDKDPRLKQKANPDTTINRFRSMTQQQVVMLTYEIYYRVYTTYSN